MINEINTQNRIDETLSRIRKLKLVLSLTMAYLGVQVIGGLLTGSLALIANAGHMLTDAAGLGLALIAINFTRKPPTPQRTYGFYRVEILAALANSIILMLVSGYILYEAYMRKISPPAIQSFSVIVVASIGLVVNFISKSNLTFGQ